VPLQASHFHLKKVDSNSVWQRIAKLWNIIHVCKNLLCEAWTVSIKESRTYRPTMEGRSVCLPRKEEVELRVSDDH
jgi:hypothetical protein